MNSSALLSDIDLPKTRTQAIALVQPEKHTMNWTTAEGTPFPLGANWVEEAKAWNFALYSKDAEDVTLLLYAKEDLVNPVFTYRFDYLCNKSARIWHCRVPQTLLRGAKYYAYSVGGPNSQGKFEFHCFDADKVLLDPYARSVYFPPAFERSCGFAPRVQCRQSAARATGRCRRET